MASGLGIDIGNESIKIVRVTVSGGKVAVTGAMKIPRKGGAESEAAEKSAVSIPPELGKQMKIAGFNPAGTVGVTGRDVNLKYVSVPPVPPDKLRKLLEMELGGKVAFKGSLDDEGPAITYDWRLMNVAGGLKSDLLVMAGLAKQEYLMGVHKALKDAGVNVETLTPSAFGLVNAYLKTHTPAPGETVVLCDVGHEMLEIAILEEGNVYFARSAPGGGKRFNQSLDKVLQTGPERAAIFKHERARIYPEGAELRSKQDENFQPALREGADVIAAAIRSSIMFCRTQAKMPKLDFNRVFLSGGGARVKGLCEYLEKKLGRPVQPLNLAANVNLGKLGAESAQLFENPISDMTCALGLAIIDSDPKSFHFRLVPEPLLQKRSFWRKTMVGVAAAALLLVGLVPPYLYAQKASAEATSAVTAFKDRNDAAIKDKKAYDKFVQEKKLLAAKADYYARLTRMPRVYPELFFAIRTNTPNKVILDYIGPKLNENAQAGNGLGGWKADAPVDEFEIRGSYEKDAYPLLPTPMINQAWLKMRTELLKVPGVQKAELKALDNPERVTALEKVGRAPFYASITLQRDITPLKSVGETTEPVKTK